MTSVATTAPLGGRLRRATPPASVGLPRHRGRPTGTASDNDVQRTGRRGRRQQSSVQPLEKLGNANSSHACESRSDGNDGRMEITNLGAGGHGISQKNGARWVALAQRLRCPLPRTQGKNKSREDTNDRRRKKHFRAKNRGRAHSRSWPTRTMHRSRSVSV